jgi:hypothetical protein
MKGEMMRARMVLWMALAAWPASLGGCSGSQPMGTLTQGVAGPFQFAPDDPTTLDSSAATGVDQYTATIYVQAVVDSVLTGETVTATWTPGNATQTFTAPEDGDVGIAFKFSGGPFAPGNYQVAVTHGSQSVGSVSWTIAGPSNPDPTTGEGP